MADLFECSGPRQLSRKTSEGLARALTGDFLSSSPPRGGARLSPSMRTSMSRYASTPRGLRSLRSGGSLVSNESFVSALTRESMERAIGSHLVTEARCGGVFFYFFPPRFGLGVVCVTRDLLKHETMCFMSRWEAAPGAGKAKTPKTPPNPQHT